MWSGSLQNFQKEVQRRLQQLAAIDYSGDPGAGAGATSPQQSAVLESKVKALIMDTIHEVDIIKQARTSYIYIYTHLRL